MQLRIFFNDGRLANVKDGFPIEITYDIKHEYAEVWFWNADTNEVDHYPKDSIIAFTEINGQIVPPSAFDCCYLN